MLEMDMSVNFKDLSYKELQTVAKRWSLPANMRRDILEPALVAYQVGDLPSVQNMVNLHKTARKRKIGLKPQNLSTSKRRKKSPKSKNKDESVVDSTSQEVGDITSFNSAGSVFTTNNMGFPDLENCPSNYFCNKVRVNPSQQHEHVAELEQSNAVDMSGDTHFIGHAVSYNNQFDFKNPSTSSTPFDVLKYSSQNPIQYYQQPDGASKSFMHYNCEHMYYPNPHSQTTSYSNDISYNTDGSGNSHQLPNYTRNSSMSVMQCSNTITNKNNCMSLSALSQSGYFGKDANNMPAIENDYPSPYLPNIPELADVTAENAQTSHFPSLLSQQDLHNNEPGRTRYMYEVQNQGIMLNSQNLSRKTVDATNTNFTFDKYSDEETLSLNEDVVNLLEMNKTDSHKNFLSTYGHGGGTYYVRPNKEYNIGSVDRFCTRPESQNISLVETISGSNSLCPNQTTTYSQNESVSRNGFGSSNLSNYSIESIVAPQTPLPPISTLFIGTNYNHAINSHQQEPHRQVSCTPLNNSACTDTTFTSENETASFVENCSSNVISNKDDFNCINLITPTSSPPGNDASNSILRNCLQVNKMTNIEVVPFGKSEPAVGGHSALQTQLIGKAVPPFQKKTNLSFPQVKAANKSSSIITVPHSVLLQKSMQENQLNMNVREILVQANSELFKEEENTDVKTKVSHFIYESETLHRSKIIYNFLKKDSSKGENAVHNVLKMFEYAELPKRKCFGMQPVTVINAMAEGTQKKTNAFAVFPAYNRPCVNEKRGCDVVLHGDSLTKHEKKCLFKLISCPSDMCSWRNSIKLLAEHIYEDHADEVEKRNQYLFILDRKKSDDRTRRTYYQVHKKTIYIIRLHIEDNKCVATIQHIPEMEIVFRQEKPACVMMQMYAFCNKIRMKSWTGETRPYYEDDGQKVVDLMINVRNSEFIGLRIVID